MTQLLEHSLICSDEFCQCFSHLRIQEFALHSWFKIGRLLASPLTWISVAARTHSSIIPTWSSGSHKCHVYVQGCGVWNDNSFLLRQDLSVSQVYGLRRSPHTGWPPHGPRSPSKGKACEEVVNMSASCQINTYMQYECDTAMRLATLLTKCPMPESSTTAWHRDCWEVVNLARGSYLICFAFKWLAEWRRSCWCPAPSALTATWTPLRRSCSISNVGLAFAQVKRDTSMSS